MSRGLSLTLLALLVVVAVALFIHYSTRGNETDSTVAAVRTPADTLARLDSVERSNARAARDTMCLASRIGLPCDPR